MSVLVVGSVALDTVETPYGRADRVLGGSASYFSISASKHAGVRVVAVVGEDFPPEHLELLSSLGVDVGGVARLPGESFSWSGSYSRSLKQATTHETRLGVFERFAPKLSVQERESKHVFLANIDPELQLDVLEQVRAPELVVLDTMNYWIHSKRDALERVISRVDVVMLNDEELSLLTGDDHLVRASRKLLDEGPRVVVVKKGENGAFLRSRDDFFATVAFPTERVVDPTGAGDSFAGGFVGYLARHGMEGGTSRQAVARGVTMASFTVESFSTERLAGVSDEEIAERHEGLRLLTSLEAARVARDG